MAETRKIMTDEQRQQWSETGLFPLELWAETPDATPLQCPIPDKALLRSIAESIPAHILASGWYAKGQSGGFQSVYADNFRGMGRQAIACAPSGKNYFGLLAEYIAAACPRTVLRLLDRIDELEAAVLSANAGKVDEWLPIDSAPKDGALIAFNRSKRISIEWGSHIHSLMDAALADGDDCFYTHWMPLPDSPTQQAIDAGRQE